MSAKIIDIAEAVVALANAGEFDLEFTAARRYIVDLKLAGEELKGLCVSVVARDDQETGQSRANTQHDYGIDIGVQQKVDPSETATLDALVAFVEALRDHLAAPANRRLASPVNTVLSAISIDPIYDTDGLKQRRVFTSLIHATYRAVRA